MISFKVLTKENEKEILASLSVGGSDEARSVLCEIASSLIYDGGDDIEYALSISHGCALIRVFDMGRYLFVFPYEIEEDADIALAIGDVAEYAKREELPLVFTDVPKEALSLLSVFRHMDLDAEDLSGETYRVRVKTECSLVSEIPEAEYGRVKLDAILDEDLPEYARLCKSKNVNKYWGYDYSEDVSDPADTYFLDNSRREFASGVAVSFAIRAAELFAGEAVIYAFDGMGGAEFAVRLLPEWQGQGLGRDAALATISAARKMGLVYLRSRILDPNLPSHAMVRPIMELVREEEGAKIYECRLDC